MITYVDTSTLIKLLIDEPGSDRAELIWESAQALACSRLVYPETRATLAAARRAQCLSAAQFKKAKLEFHALWDQLNVVDVFEELATQGVSLPSGTGCVAMTRFISRLPCSLELRCSRAPTKISAWRHRKTEFMSQTPMLRGRATKGEHPRRAPLERSQAHRSRVADTQAQLENHSSAKTWGFHGRRLVSETKSQSARTSRFEL